jgi:L-alanine-DL-glutamate epimerase-like enolase superfamily enzyme
LEDDILTEPHRIERGFMALPDGPGLGVAVDERKVKKYRV